VADHSPPCAVRSVDLERPLEPVELGRSARGQPYDRVLALIRLHGDTLAALEIPAPRGRLEAAELSEAIWPAVCERLHRHVRANRCAHASTVTRNALIEGLPSDTCGPPRAPTELPSVSVVVCTLGVAKQLSACVSSIVGQAYPNFELVIVDNAGEDTGLRELLATWDNGGAAVRYVQEPVRGLARARNRGLAAAAGEIVAFTDDDVRVDPDWLTWLVGQFAAEPRIGAVTGLVMPACLDTEEERVFEQVNGYGRGLDPLSFDMDCAPVRDDPLFPYWGAAFGSGNNMAFRKTTLRAIGGFDEALGPGTPTRNGEEIDAFTRTLLRGERLVYEPRAICWHHHRSTQAALRNQALGYAAGTTAVFAKWSLRDPRLLPRLLRAAAGVLAPGGKGDRRVPRETARLRSIMRTYRAQGVLYRQLLGFALGPFLYAYSALRARRLPAVKAPGPAPARPESALLITVTDGAPDRLRTLRDLLASIDGNNSEVIVVVRGDAPAVNGAGHIRTLRAPPDLPLSSARNLALRHAREQGMLRPDRIVGFPDDDCVYPQGLLRAVGRVMQEAGVEVVCGAYAPDPSAVDPDRFPPHRIELTPRLVPALCSSAATFMTGAVVLEVGMFDERFGVGARLGAAEDTDYVIRAVEAGYGALYAPDAIFVKHPYKAHRKGQYYEGTVAVLAKHARPVPRLAVSLGYRLTVGAGWVASGRVRPSHYARALRAAVAMARAPGGDSEPW
jgi:GT2 family glycosyltransferase